MLFFSYASEDRNRIRPVADALQQAGFNIWWDRAIPAGVRFNELIAEKLDASAAVLVFWSEASVRSSWVLTEAEEGLRRGVLVPVLLDDVSPPLGFRAVQAVDMRRDIDRGVEQLLAVLEGRAKQGAGIAASASAAPSVMASMPRPSAPSGAPASAASAPRRGGLIGAIVAGLVLLVAAGFWWVGRTPIGAVVALPPGAEPVGSAPPAVPAVTSVWLPSFVGASTATARLEVERLKLKGVFLDIDTRAVTDVADGVVSQQTPANLSVEAGSAVEFVIDRGVFSVPSLIGLDLSAALKVLDAKGMKLGTPLTVTIPGARVGSIVAQNPAAGASAARGTSVAVTVVGSPRAVPSKLDPKAQNNAQAVKK